MAARWVVRRRRVAIVAISPFWLLMVVGLSASLDISRRVFRQRGKVVLSTSDSEGDSIDGVK